MSLSLGQSGIYINKIEYKRTLPSMQVFFYICEYFGITPSKFFHPDLTSPAKTYELIEQIGKLSPLKTEHILLLIKDLIDK